ncbi:hypothetical protein O3P69_015728 [Scylla paramamosain]|uniref:Uncharacterized protein n=1 Tax=Scylla paramamosain TaxID=85552 RepID=A0AAW0T7W7_SCYPA
MTSRCGAVRCLALPCLALPWYRRPLTSLTSPRGEFNGHYHHGRISLSLSRGTCYSQPSFEVGHISRGILKSSAASGGHAGVTGEGQAGLTPPNPTSPHLTSPHSTSHLLPVIKLGSGFKPRPPPALHSSLLTPHAPAHYRKELLNCLLDPACLFLLLLPCVCGKAGEVIVVVSVLVMVLIVVSVFLQGEYGYVYGAVVTIDPGLRHGIATTELRTRERAYIWQQRRRGHNSIA